ncbi:glycosyltransferase family 2 protein [Vibrio cyclitrophicus]
MGNSTVSIIMPAYNAGKFISESINSVLSQTYTDWQLIIIDDNSSDDTYEIVRNYLKKDSRICLLKNESDKKGAYQARNIGLESATGRYIAFLDSDDLWLPEKLKIQIDAMVRSASVASHSSYIRIDEVGAQLGKVNVNKLVTYKDQLKSNRIPNLTGIYDRSLVGVVMQRNIGHEDYDMWLRILKCSSSIGITEPLALYRVVSGSLSSNKLKAMSWHYKILLERKELNFIQRNYYFLCYIFFAVIKRW